MNSEQKRKAYKVTITGNFDYEAYLRMSGLLNKFGNVRSTFFDEKSKTRPAAATFWVSILHDADDLKTVLEQTSGVHLVTTEANDA